MEKSDHRVSRWSVSTSPTEYSLGEGGKGLPPKRYMKRRMTFARRFRYIGFAFAVIVAIAAPVTTLIMVAGYTEVYSYNYSEGGYTYLDTIPMWDCQPSGYLNGGAWSFLGIDFRFGRMSFAKAKMIDMAWNWVAGRGMQFFLAWLTYHVFTSALLRTAEITHVPYDLFTSLSFYSARPGCLWDIGKGLFTVGGVRVKFIMAWLLFSTAYLAMFPALLDVMSGYQGSIRTELVLPNKTTLDLTNVYSLEGVLWFYRCWNSTLNQFTVGQDCSGYGDNSGYQFYDSSLNSSWHAFANLSNYENASSYRSFYTTNSSRYNCVAEQDLYQWGFSGEWVLVVVCVNAFWIFGLWILWLDTELKSQLTRAGRRMGTYRAIADISEAMREDLGPNLSGYSNRELEGAVKRQGPVKYYVTAGQENEVGKIGLSSRKSKKVEVTWGREYG